MYKIDFHLKNKLVISLNMDLQYFAEAMKQNSIFWLDSEQSQGQWINQKEIASIRFQKLANAQSNPEATSTQTPDQNAPTEPPIEKKSMSPSCPNC